MRTVLQRHWTPYQVQADLLILWKQPPDNLLPQKACQVCVVALCQMLNRIQIKEEPKLLLNQILRIFQNALSAQSPRE